MRIDLDGNMRATELRCCSLGPSLTPWAVKPRATVSTAQKAGPRIQTALAHTLAGGIGVRLTSGKKYGLC